MLPPDLFEQIETESGGRLGVFARDLQTAQTVAWRADDAFPMASTIKLPLVGVILSRVAAGQELLERLIPVRAEDIVSWSPVTEPLVGQSMTIMSLCVATLKTSDNTAANLLLQTIEGPQGFTRALRQLGDAITRSDRFEPALNSVPVGDLRDTTTPKQMVELMQAFAFGSLLPQDHRDRLQRWLIATETATRRLRAQMPREWRIGDRSGTGAAGETNSVAFFGPVGRPAIVASVFLRGSALPTREQEVFHARIGRALAETITW